MLSSRSIALDYFLGSLLVAVGIALAIADALDRLPDGYGALGIGIIAIGKLTLISGMLRRQEVREVRAFELGKRASDHMLT